MSRPTSSTDQSEPTSPHSASTVVGVYLAQHCRALLEGDHGVRRGDDAGVHTTRVASRRVRSVLRVYGSLFDPGAARALDLELRWWASRLGPVRDLQVLQNRLDAMVAEVDAGLPMGPAKSRIDDELERARRRHWEDVQAELLGERHSALLAELKRWGTQPPWTAQAGRPASALVPRAVGADRTVARRLTRAVRSGDAEDLHHARKAAKRARYAAEVVAAITGEHAVKDVKRYEQLQDLLGEHQDSIVSAALLRRLGAEAAPGDDGFGFGMLYEREQERAREARLAVRRMARRYR